MTSGVLAGLILGGANLVFVEPSLDQAIGIENQHLFATGEEKDTPEFQTKYEGFLKWRPDAYVRPGPFPFPGRHLLQFCESLRDRNPKE